MPVFVELPCSLPILKRKKARKSKKKQEKEKKEKGKRKKEKWTGWAAKLCTRSGAETFICYVICYRSRGKYVCSILFGLSFV